MSCECPDPAIKETSRQVNEDERQVTKTCVRCETVVSNTIVEVRR